MLFSFRYLSAIRAFIVSAVLTVGLCVYSASAQTVRSANTEVEFISQYLSVPEKSTVQIALKMVMDPEWHVYWKNPGDSGLTPKIKWHLPDGVLAQDIQWPVPEKIEVAGLTSYGYSHSVYLVSDIIIPSEKLGEDLFIKADVQWLACKIQCVGGTAELSATIQVGDKFVLNPRWQEVKKYFDHVPSILDMPEGLTVVDTKESFSVKIPVRHFKKNKSIDSMYVFPDRDDVIDHAAKQNIKKDKKTFTIEMPKSSLLNEVPERFAGVLTVGFSDKTREAYAFDVLLEEENASSASEISSLWAAVMFAFLGGLILNLMPCVLPVLSIKILHLVEYHNQGRAQALKHTGIFSLGVISAFWILALGLYVFKIFGTSLGWGFQFQSPVFLVILSMLFFWLALNLFGMFEMGVGLTQISSRTSQSEGSYKGSFLSGVLTAIVATPCTAPFMGSALGYALVRPAGYSLVVFTALGVGMVFPYLILSQFPKLLKFVPKPGAWMIRLKQFFGVLFLLTATWLVWVLFVQKGFQAVIGVLIAFLILFNAGWILFKYARLSATSKQKKVAGGVVVGSFLIAFFIGMVFSYGSTFIHLPKSLEYKSASAIDWQAYSPEKLAQSLETGRPVFVDFTAEWCLSCKANEKIALNSKKVAERFKELGVIAIKVDLTDYDKVTTEALESYGKKSIPVYVFYAQGKHSDPVFLPEILTPGIVLKYLEEIPLQK